MSFSSDLRADLRRNEDNFGKIAVILLRLSRHLPGALAIFPDVLMRLICGAEIPRSVKVGPGLRLPHGGRGVVVHWKSSIGADVTIYHGVTLGVSGPSQGAPVLRDRVYVGTGACILGGVTVESDAKIGANSVVLDDVPTVATAVGVPASVRTRRQI